MKHIFLVYFFPFILAITSVLYISYNKKINNLFFEKPITKNTSKPTFNFIGNFENDNSIFEGQFLVSNDSTETIFLLGSSELVHSSPAIPYNFISDHFKTKLKAVGHAGNQCFSIYTQLLANYKRLNNAPIVIILSPGWFESKASKGTTSKIFLEFNSESFLKDINSNNVDIEFKNYANKRISQLYSEFNSPNLQLKLMNFQYRSSVSLLHKIIFYPLIFCDHILSDQKEKLESIKQTGTAINRRAIIPQAVSINWDSLFSSSKKEVLSKATNNNLGVENEYYTEYVHGKTGNMQPVPAFVNQELEDFKMLLKLVKEKNINVRFIISPLNPLYYKNLRDLLPTVSLIENEIKNKKIIYLNMFETDESKYDKAILRDIMHMSDYGWYKVDQFIINTYHLAK